MSRRLPSQSSLRSSKTSKDKPLRFNVRHLDVEIKQRQRAKVAARAKQRRKQRTISLTALVIASFIFVNVSNGTIQNLTQKTNTAIKQSIEQTQTTLFETRQRIVDIPKAFRVKRFVQPELEQISLPKDSQSAPQPLTTVPMVIPQMPSALGLGLGLGQQGTNQLITPIPEASAPTDARIFENLTTRPVKIALQIGHLDVANHPDELANLRQNTGGLASGVAEIDVNKKVANIVKKQLEYYEDIRVELLPATVPPNYKADVFISIHADSSTDPKRRGYKSAFSLPERNTTDKLLKDLVDESFFNASGLPDDHENVSSNMTKYYAFNRARFMHSIAAETPALIIEMGYLSHEQDVVFLKDTKRPATALTEGILKYLNATGLISHLPYQPNYALQTASR